MTTATLAAPTVRTEIVDVTPDMAAQLLAQTVTSNRTLRDRWVDTYASEMAAGRWMLTGETIKLDTEGNVIDGQHRLWAIAKSGVTVPTIIVYGLDHSVIRVIDTAIRRSAADSLRFAGFDLPYVEATASVARLAILYETDQLKNMSRASRPVSHLAIVEWVERWGELAQDSVRFAYTFRSRIAPVTPSPLAFAHFYLSQLDVMEAEKFWAGIANLATEGKHDPRQTLLRSLVSDESKGNQGAMIGRTFTTWNAWRDDQRLTALPVVDRKGMPLPIPKPI
jgi:hypothetical protein